MENNADKDKRCVARTQLDYMKIRQEYSSGGCSWYRNVGHKISLWRMIGNKNRRNQTSFFFFKNVDGRWLISLATSMIKRIRFFRKRSSFVWRKDYLYTMCKYCVILSILYILFSTEIYNRYPMITRIQSFIDLCWNVETIFLSRNAHLLMVQIHFSIKYDVYQSSQPLFLPSMCDQMWNWDAASQCS